MTYRVRNIGIAVALAAVAALLTSFYVTSYKRHVQRNEDHVTVLVAKKNLTEGMTGAEASGLLSSMEVPRRSVVPGAATAGSNVARSTRCGSSTDSSTRWPTGPRRWCCI